MHPSLFGRWETLFEVPLLPPAVSSNLCHFWDLISLSCRVVATIFTVWSWVASCRWAGRADWIIFLVFFIRSLSAFALNAGWESIGVIYRGLHRTSILPFWERRGRFDVIFLFCGLLIIIAILWNLDYRHGTSPFFMCWSVRQYFGSVSSAG